MSLFNGAPLGVSKATPASFHTQAAPINGGGQSRNTPAAPLNVGHMAATAQKVVSDAATGVVKGVRMIGSVAQAAGKSLTGQDDFTKQVSAQAKAGRGKY